MGDGAGAGAPLRVSLVRSGGFAGLSVRADVDTAALPPERAAHLTALAEGVDFAALAAAPPPPRRGADRFTYELDVRCGEDHHHLRLADGAVPPELRPLLDAVLAARRSP